MDELPGSHVIVYHEKLPFRPDDLERVLAHNLTSSSIAMYRRDIAAYSRFVTEREMDPLDHQTLAEWRDELILSSSLSPNTINRMLSAVRRLMREAADRQRVTREVDACFARVAGVTLKAMKNRLKEHARTRIEPEDMRRLCDTPDRSTPIGARDAALLATLASSGIRVDEGASLSWHQIKRQGTGYILLVKGKTDIEYRKAHLSTEAYQLLMQWKAAQPVFSGFVFTAFSTKRHEPSEKPLTKTGVWKIVTHYAAVCGIPHLKPHDFRRFVGTQLAQQDIRKAQKALGHRSIETTARHYVLDDLEPGLTDNLY